jgi:propanediol dehydratase small subunit
MTKACTMHLKDYPLGKKRPEKVTTFTGKKLDDITLAAVLNGDISDNDIRISPEVLLMQAEISELSGRRWLANNFHRAAEICRLPDDKVLDIYNSLRPYRCSSSELETIANELEHKYGAVFCANLVREAADAYLKRGFLKKNDLK